MTGDVNVRSRSLQSRSAPGARARQRLPPAQPESTMMPNRFFSALCLAALVFALRPASAADGPAAPASPADGAVGLFNGKDLTGWGYKTGEKFDGKIDSDDKRFSAKDGMIIVNAATDANKGIKQLWTTRKFPMDFTLKLEFRAAVNADSG